MDRKFLFQFHQSPKFSFNFQILIRFQSTASHLFARTRSFHRPTSLRPDSHIQQARMK